MTTETKRVPEQLRANLTNREFIVLVDEAMEMRRQRDELAAALRQCVSTLRTIQNDNAVEQALMDFVMQDVSLADAALAKLP